MSTVIRENDIGVTDRFLTFSVTGDDYGIEIEYVKDIVQLQSITRVPGVPSYISGVMNLRGTIVPVVDVCIRFGKGEQERNERTCIVVVALDDMQIGMVVESVHDVPTIPPSSITAPPKMSAASENRYVRAIGTLNENHIILLLDVEKLFYDGDMQMSQTSNEMGSALAGAV